MQACIFEGGKMTQIYTDLTPSKSSFDIRIEKHAGTLYVLANTQEQINLEELKSQNITEEEWLKKCMTMKDNAPVQFYSGSLSLNDMSNSQTVLPVNLKRGFCPFRPQLENDRCGLGKQHYAEECGSIGLSFPGYPRTLFEGGAGQGYDRIVRLAAHDRYTGRTVCL